MRNETKTYHHLWDTAKTVLRVRLIALIVNIKIEEKSQMNAISFHLKHLEKPKASGRKEIKLEQKSIKLKQKKGENQ